MSTAKNKAYIFFNCDGEKSLASKNITYNNAIFGDAKTSRKLLWKKIQTELEASRVVIAENDLDKAQQAVLEGNPVDAAKYMQFGDIVELERY